MQQNDEYGRKELCLIQINGESDAPSSTWGIFQETIFQEHFLSDPCR